MADPIDNGDFSNAGAAQGEAADWTWGHVQAQGGWALFNEALPAYAASMESFEAGWDDNEDWIDELENLIAAVFNEGGGQYESTQESFELWDGLPWRDDFTTTAAEWTSWYNELHGVTTYPLSEESFDEAWLNEPLSTEAGPKWIAGSTMGGRLFSDALTFPLIVTSNRNKMWLFRVDDLDIMEMTVAAGEYSTAAALAAALDTALDTAFGAATKSLQFGSSGDDMIWLGWDGSGTHAENVLLCHPGDDRKSRDIRETIGLKSLSPTGGAGTVSLPLAILNTLPPASLSTETWWVDQWSQIRYTIETEPRSLYDFALEYARTPVVFDDPADPSYFEMFTLTGWFGAGKVWKDRYDPGDLTAAVFNDYGTGTPTTLESFEELWDEEPFPF